MTDLILLLSDKAGVVAIEERPTVIDHSKQRVAVVRTLGAVCVCERERECMCV